MLYGTACVYRELYWKVTRGSKGYFLTPVLFAIRFLDAQPCTMLVTSLDFPMPASSVIKRLWPTETNCFTSACSALRAILTKKAAARDYPGVAGNFAQSLDHIDQKLHCIIVASR